MSGGPVVPDIRAVWQANTVFSPGDVFTYNGGVYEVTATYTSGGSFGATDLANTTLWEAQSGTYASDPTTTKGDLIARAASALARLGVGTDGQVLSADSTQPTGLAWAVSGSGGAVSNATWKAAVRVTVVNIDPSSPGATIDGVTMATGDRVLVTGQGAANGIYTFATSTTPMSRATDANTSAQVPPGMTVFVSEGTQYGNSVWRLTNDAPIVLGTTSLVFTDAMTAPGTGANSERFGSGSIASGVSSVAFGNSAAAAGANGTAVGLQASASSSQSTAIGRSAAAAGGSGATALGYGSSAGGSNSTALGNSAAANPSGSVVIGGNATAVAANTGAVVVGQGATAGGGTNNSGEQVVVGATATATEWRATAVGWHAQATAISATAIGRGAFSAFTHAVALGRGSWTNANNQLALGFSGGDAQTDVHFESGHTHKYVDTDGTTITRNPSLTPIAIHGFDAFDATGTPTNNVAGGNLILDGGRGTGTAAGGSVKLQVAPAGGASNNTKNALVDVVVAGVSGTSSALAFFGGSLATKWTSLPVDATDLASAIALVNDIKNNVVKRYSLAA